MLAGGNAAAAAGGGSMLHLLGQALFGLVVGAIDKLIFPGRDPGGVIVTALLGLVGSLIGTFVGRARSGSGAPNAGDGMTYAVPGLSPCPVIASSALRMTSKRTGSISAARARVWAGGVVMARSWYRGPPAAAPGGAAPSPPRGGGRRRSAGAKPSRRGARKSAGA